MADATSGTRKPDPILETLSLRWFLLALLVEWTLRRAIRGREG